MSRGQLIWANYYKIKEKTKLVVYDRPVSKLTVLQSLSNSLVC